jgi:hypothetical protein
VASFQWGCHRFSAPAALGWRTNALGAAANAASISPNQFGVILATSNAVGLGEGWSALELAAIEELSGTLPLAIKGNIGA